MQGSDFFARLYAGFEAEHFITGKLFGAGLEGFKLPADFGFDLLVSNQMEALSGSPGAARRAYSFPYVIQVKSRKVTEAHLKPAPNGRSEAQVSFRVSRTEFDLLQSEDRSYLVCVAFLRERARSIGDQVCYFWIKGSQLAELREHSYLADVEDGIWSGYDLQVGFRFRPKQGREELLGSLLKQGELTEKGAKELQRVLPSDIAAEWGSEYAVLYRRKWTSGAYAGERDIARKLWPDHLDISRIGMEAMFPTDDSCESFPR